MYTIDVLSNDYYIIFSLAFYSFWHAYALRIALVDLKAVPIAINITT